MGNFADLGKHTRARRCDGGRGCAVFWGVRG